MILTNYFTESVQWSDNIGEPELFRLFIIIVKNCYSTDRNVFEQVIMCKCIGIFLRYSESYCYLGNMFEWNVLINIIEIPGIPLLKFNIWDLIITDVMSELLVGIIFMTTENMN